MSEATRARIAVLQHKRKQEEFREKFARISNSISEAPHPSLEAGTSVKLQDNLYAKLKDMRTRKALQQYAFADMESALKSVLDRLGSIGSGAVFEVYAGASGSGFFVGPVSCEFLKCCLRQGYEGFVAVLQRLDVGVVLDVVRDDPAQGDFYEVAWW